MFNGKQKAVTFSYDDGITQDKRLISILNKYGLKATFNINSGYLGTSDSLIREDVTVAFVRPRAEEIRSIYEGHEIAGHSLTHALLTKCSDEQVIKEVEEDRLRLSELAGYEVCGFAYPGGSIGCFDDRVARIIKEHTGIKYARTAVSSHSFSLPDNIFQYKPTVYHHTEWDKMFDLAKEFLSSDTKEAALFYVWGHSFEFDIHNTWDRFEEFCRLISGHNDVFYGTNREVFDI